MSDESQVEGTENEEAAIEEPSELDTLKARAKLLGIKHHHNIGVAKLKALIDEHMNPKKEEPAKEAPKAAAKPAPGPVDTSKYDPMAAMSPAQKRRYKKSEASKLVRVRVNCMDPDKKEYDGEILSVGNRSFGTIKRYVPYNSEEPTHVEQMILNFMRERKCTVMRTVTENGRKVQRKALIPAYSIEVLPPLKPDELALLRKTQAARDGV
jgi:hypothetical protein